jgi:hypothetical protein
MCHDEAGAIVRPAEPIRHRQLVRAERCAELHLGGEVDAQVHPPEVYLAGLGAR